MDPFCCVPCPSPPRPWPAHRPPSLGAMSAELATTTYVALETVAGEEGCGGHMECLPKGGGRLPFQPLPHHPEDSAAPQPLPQRQTEA